MLQNVKSIIIDNKFLLGVGIGMLIATLIMTLASGASMSKSEIEMKAREYGMKYPSEVKVLD